MKLDEEKEKLRAFYRDSVRTKFKNGSEGILFLIQEGGEINTHKVAHYYKKLEYSPREGITISPTFMKFKEPLEGISWRKRLTIKNTGVKAVEIGVFPPNSIAFRIDKVTKRKILHPGLSLHVWVTYSFKRPSLLHAYIPIKINGDLINYHLVSNIGTPNVVANPTFIDFEKVDINFESKTKILTLKNVGEKSTKFSLDVTVRGINIIVSPMRGTIKAGHEVQLKVKVIGSREGTFVTEFWIKTSQHIRVLLKADIIVPKFEAYHPNSTGDSLLIDFPPTFINNLKYETFVMRNVSSRTVNFIVLADINGELVDTSEIDTVKYPAYSVFKVFPTDGRIEPFEGRIFTITFSPTTESTSQLRKKNACSSRDFLAFLKILRFQVLEVDSKRNADIENSFSEESMHNSSQPEESVAGGSESTYTNLLEEPDSISITLCVHGEIENSRLKFVPDTLYLGAVLIGEKTTRVILISNPCLQETLTFRFVTNPDVRCIPKEGILGPNNSLEVLIEVKAKLETQPILKLKFDIFATTFSPFPSLKQKSRKVFSYSVLCFQNIMMESKKEAKLTLIRGFETRKDEICDHVKLPKMKNDFSLIRATQKIQTFESKSTSRALILPLSPLQIYNIKAWPTILNFGKIANFNTAYQKIEFENKNNVSVTIRLISQHIFFSDANLIILKPKTKVEKLVGFHAKNESMFNSRLNYIINDNHHCELKIAGEIVDQYLKLDTEEVLFGKEYFLEEAYQPNFTHVEIKNELNADTLFNWKMDTESSFLVEPMSGSVRAYRNLYIYVSYEPDPLKSNETEIMMNCKTSYTDLKLKKPISTANVAFIESDINIGKIPLNIPVEGIAVLHNNDFSTSTFQVDQKSLLLGIKVHPDFGVIPPRGIKILRITMNFEACIKFTTFIKVIVQSSLQLMLKVSGQVYFPILKMIPDRIEMRRISADSQQTHLISMKNEGETKLKLQFLLDKYPEFSISFLPEKKDILLDADEVTINPSSTQTFYLHFSPIDPVSYLLHLPILINGMIGPSSIEDPKTLKPSEYLKPKEAEYSKISEISLIKLPSKLEKIDIVSSVTDHHISFNNLTFKFDTAIDKLEEKLIITNHAQEESSFIIRVDSFQKENSPFQISWTSGPEPTITPLSIVSTLLPHEEIIFIINFKSTTWGYFELEAPIFVRGQLNGNLYNMLRIEGNNPRSTIESAIQEIYFNPLPLNKEEVQIFTLITKNFKTDSKMLVKICNPERSTGLFTNETLQVEFPNGNLISKNRKGEIEFTIRVKNPEPVSFSTKVEFFDHENTSSLSVTIYGNIDNCLLSTYAYQFQTWNDIQEMHVKKTQLSDKMQKSGTKISVQETKPEFFYLSYPYFPINSKNRSYELYMTETLLAAEEWLYSDVLKFNFYPEILDGITAAVSDIYKIKGKNDKMKAHSVKQSFFTVLEILIGPNFKSRIQIPDLLPEKNCERITLLLEKYTEMLEFLYTEGAFLPHVSPKFLLNYNDYLTTLEYKENQLTNPDKKLKDAMPKQIFESRSKQCWLDLILQTYKCFKLGRMEEEKEKREKTFEKLPPRRRSKPIELKKNKILRFRKNSSVISNSKDKNSGEIITEKAKTHKNRHISEAILLAWMEYHFENIYNKDENVDQLKLKLIDNFDICLTDGLIFIALTKAYCPFLNKEFFKNIYIFPKTPEEALHNSICIVTAWKKIRLGFLVKPIQIIHPNCVHMLMLVTHLYIILPTYMAKTKVEFNCALTKSITKSITVTNPTDNPVNFIIELFDNEFEFFSLASPQKILKLNPRANKKITVKFEARKFAETKAFLLVAGSAFGPHFAPNQTFVLEGNTNELFIFNEYLVISRMYETMDTILSINVPYKKEINYDIWISEEEPKDFSTLKMSQWSNIHKRKVPRRLFLNQKQLSVSENAFKANLSITFACLTRNPQNYWLIFKSEESDFIIKITSISKAPLFERLTIIWEVEPCICDNPPTEINIRCPLNIKMMIPSKNAQIWKCISQMLKKTMHTKEWSFWSRILETNFGVRLIQWHMGDHHDSFATEISHLFETCVTYNVTNSDNMKFLRIPDKLSISDVELHKGETELTLHISEETPPNYETILKLKSLKKEIRNYKLKFLRQE